MKYEVSTGNMTSVPIDVPAIDLELSSKLCDAIIHWQAENPIRSIRSNRRIDWTAVSGILQRVYSIEKSADDCHRLWKFLAYGGVYEKHRFLDDSDCEEAFLQPIEAFDRMRSAEEIRNEFERTGRKKLLRRKASSTGAESRDHSRHVKVFVPNRVGKSPNDIQSIIYKSDPPRTSG